ncbi:hypothetical protein H8K32_17530 [Undibacterium jejuense]|uniref:Uncharacterized protein n=1 Tax=Undibacterium jejuense TaxID=1344949 RepID=A0A923HH26_9BURK|nr:hypothetical protein [Undibacterium jejuense]MBC3863911.1 hypothetical protein [Undibacterium jejuense]
MKGIARENVITTVLNFFLYTGIGIAVLLIMIIRVIQQRTMDADLGMIFTGLFCFVLTIRVLIAIANLASVSRVLQHQITPKNLWQASLKCECQNLLRDYLVAAITLVVYFLIAAPTSLNFSLMLMSLSCALSVFFGLANNGFLNLKWQRIILFLYGLAIIMLLASRTTTIVFNSLHQISNALLLVIAALMPAMLIWQIKRPVDRLLVNVSTTKTSPPDLLERIRRELKRYTEIKTQYKWNKKYSSFNLIMNQLWPIIYILFWPSVVTALIPNTVSGEDGVTCNRLLVLLVGSVMFSAQLVARDLHWRYLLSPGGLERRRLASLILFSTIRLQVSAYLCLGILATTIGLLIAPQSTYETIITIPKFWRLPFEWTAMLCLAIFFASLRGWKMIGLAIVCIMTIVGLLMYFPTFSHQKSIALFPANYLYIAGLMLFAYYTMRINNRRWNAHLLFEKFK